MSKGYGNKNPQNGKKNWLNSTCPIQTVYEGSSLWQVWHMRSTLDDFQKSNNSREIEYHLHINTLLFLWLTEMDVWLNAVHDPVFVRGDTWPGQDIAPALTCPAEGRGTPIYSRGPARFPIRGFLYVWPLPCTPVRSFLMISFTREKTEKRNMLKN